AIGATHYGIAQLRGIEVLRPADAILPFDRPLMIELEAPVRCDPFGFLRRALGRGKPERPAVVDRRQPATERDLALEVELLRRLIAGIDPLRRLQPLECLVIQRQPLRLPLLTVRLQPEPSEIGADRVDEPLFA